ncbi:MAG TPA: hypothetical protein VFY71_02255 [Planctomycetota bacterium]|nr:hypothetical protein [Planctomycetota bacterium]
MTRSTPTACTRARTLRPALRAGLAPDAGLLRHVATCPRCRAALLGPGAAPPETASAGVGYVLAVARAAAAVRIAALLEDLARACAAQVGAAEAAPAGVARARPVPEVLADLAALRRRLGAQDPLRDAPPWPAAAPPASSRLEAARACLLAAEHVEGRRASRQLELAACALAAHDRAGAGAVCSALVAAAGRGASRSRLVRRAELVARAWGVAPHELTALLRQPQRAACN